MHNKRYSLATGAAVAASLVVSASSVPVKVLNAFTPKQRKGKDGTDYDPNRTVSKRSKRRHQTHNSAKRYLPAQAPIPLKFMNRPVREHLAAQGFSYALPVQGGYEGWAEK